MDYYNYLWGDWELRLRWHVMIPPHDWTIGVLLNYRTGDLWYVFIDTDGVFHEYSDEVGDIECLLLMPYDLSSGLLLR